MSTSLLGSKLKLPHSVPSQVLTLHNNIFYSISYLYSQIFHVCFMAVCCCTDDNWIIVLNSDIATYFAEGKLHEIKSKNNWTNYHIKVL